MKLPEVKTYHAFLVTSALAVVVVILQVVGGSPELAMAIAGCSFSFSLVNYLLQTRRMRLERALSLEIIRCNDLAERLLFAPEPLGGIAILYSAFLKRDMEFAIEALRDGKVSRLRSAVEMLRMNQELATKRAKFGYN